MHVLPPPSGLASASKLSPCRVVSRSDEGVSALSVECRRSGKISENDKFDDPAAQMRGGRRIGVAQVTAGIDHDDRVLQRLKDACGRLWGKVRIWHVIWPGAKLSIRI